MVGFSGINAVQEYNPENVELNKNTYLKPTSWNARALPLSRRSYLSQNRINNLWGSKSNNMREATTRELLSQEEFDRAYSTYYKTYLNRGLSNMNARNRAAKLANAHITKHNQRISHKAALRNRANLEADQKYPPGKVITRGENTKEQKKEIADALANIRREEQAYRNKMGGFRNTRKRKTRSKA